MWSSLFLPGFASAQEFDLDEDEAVMIDSVNEGPGHRIPNPEELIKVLDSMRLSEEEKNNLRESLMKNTPGVGAETEKAFVASDFISQTLLLLAFLSLICLIFVFFGYKLYKSLSERERKREEKRKMKQLKKKK